MSESDRFELYKQHALGESKYTYFLLAAAASAITLAVQKTSGLGLSWFQIPLAFAVLSWGVSFYFGCQCLTLTQAIIYLNVQLLEITDAASPIPHGNPELVQTTKQRIKSSMEEKNKKATANDLWQFRLLIIGAILFLVWHVLEMFRLTFCT